MRRKLLRMHGSPIKRLTRRFQNYSVASADLELLDRMLSSLESRRNKALGCVAEYRASLAHQLRESADRIIDGKGVLRLEDAPSERSTAA